MAEGELFRDKVTGAGVKIADGKITDPGYSGIKSGSEIGKIQVEKVNLWMKLRDIFRGIKENGLGSLTKIE